MDSRQVGFYTGFLWFTWVPLTLANPLSLQIPTPAPAVDLPVVPLAQSGAQIEPNFAYTLLSQTPPAVPPGVLEPSRPTLPPFPDRPPSPAAPPQIQAPQGPLSPASPTQQPGIVLKGVEILGSTIFSPQELAALAAPYIGKTVTFEQLLALRTAVTDYYTSRGYTTSGAFLPPQDVAGGIVKIQVVEGELEKIEIKGLGRLQDDYVRSRIGLASSPPINIRKLETALQLLQLDPLFTSVQAELTAGTTPGRSILLLNLKEAPTLAGTLQVDNRNSPSVGSIGGTVTVSEGNLLGFGDRLSGDYQRTEGISSYNLSYEIPLTPQDGRLTLRYSNSNSKIIEQPFTPLDINSQSQTYSLSFRQPIDRTPTNEFGLSLGLDVRQSQTYLLSNIPFSFSVGPENGRSAVTVIRFSQDWINRSPNRVLAARSQFSLGIDALGATVNNSGTDGRFFSWVGQFQWVQALGDDTIAIARVGTQLTGNSLLPLEQFSIGGVDTVRGYRQNQRVGDNGIVGSAEVRIPIVRDPNGLGTIQLVPFFDIGTVWNSNGTPIANQTLSSVGLGLRWQIAPYYEARLDWGIPFNRSGSTGSSLQDSGLYFSIQVKPF